MIALRQAAALWSDRLVAHFGSTTFDTNALAGAVADEQAGDYVRLAAALELVLRGDRAPATIALLRRVLDDGMFALTNSLIERGQASARPENAASPSMSAGSRAGQVPSRSTS